MSPEQREALRDALRVAAVLPADPERAESARPEPENDTGATGGAGAR
jgi:hypothetical protein